MSKVDEAVEVAMEEMAQREHRAAIRRQLRERLAERIGKAEWEKMLVEERMMLEEDAVRAYGLYKRRTYYMNR